MHTIRMDPLLNYPGSMVGGVGSTSYKFGIRWCKENADNHTFYMIFFYSQKLRDPRKYCFYHSGRMGVMSVGQDYINIYDGLS